MAKTYRALQQWDNWLRQSLGERVLNAERKIVSSLQAECYGTHALLLGVSAQQTLFKFDSMPCQTLLSPLHNKNHAVQRYIEGELHELPIASASIDVVLLPHSHEHVDNPRKLLMEACRIVKPEGHIIIFGFNPYSLWSLKKRQNAQNRIPGLGHFIAANKIKQWLALADFELTKHDMFLFRPPIQQENIYRQLSILEWLGGKLLKPLGGAYMIMAKAKVIPLTSIRVHWKQELSGIPLSIPGQSIRNW